MMPMRRIRSRCCARAASGHAAAPPRRLMNARRFNWSKSIRTPLARAELQDIELAANSQRVSQRRYNLSYKRPARDRLLAIFPNVILQIRMRGGQARPRHFHHPAVHLDPVAVRVEEVKGVAAAPADEARLAALRGVHVGAADDLNAARAHVIEGQQPVLA